MILSIPMASMAASACSLAPWEMESMEITLPTPKMMPSEVSTERILCSIRLWKERAIWSRNFIVLPQTP